MAAPSGTGDTEQLEENAQKSTHSKPGSNAKKSSSKTESNKGATQSAKTVKKSSSKTDDQKSAQNVTKPLSNIDEQTNENEAERTSAQETTVETSEEKELAAELKEQTDAQIDKPPTPGHQPPDADEADKHDVARILTSLMRTAEAQAKAAGDKLDMVYKKYNEAKCLPVIRGQADGMRLAAMEAVEEADCIIGELVEAIHHKEEQRRRFAQASLETFEAILDEEKEHMHRSTELCLETMGQEFDKALALIDRSNNSMREIRDHTGAKERANFDHLEGQYHAMIAWAKRTHHAMREKCREDVQKTEAEFAKSLLSSAPQVENILASLLSLYNHIQQHQELTHMETQQRRALGDARRKEDAVRREISRLRRCRESEQRRVDHYERLKRELLAAERALRGRQRAECAGEKAAESSLAELVAVKSEFWDELMEVERLCDDIACFYSKAEDD